MRPKRSSVSSPHVWIRTLAILLAISLLAAACSTASTGSPTTNTASSSASQRTTDSDPAEHGCPLQIAGPLVSWAEAGFSGALVYTSALDSDDPVDCRIGFGAANDAGDTIGPDSVFSLGSMTKTMTMVAILALVEDGVLRLDTVAGEVLTELDSAVAGLSIEQLLTHTSGLADSHGGDYEPMTRAEAVGRIADQQLLFDPGEGYGYSNSGYTLLAAIIEAVDGSYRDFMLRRVLTLSDDSVVGGFWEGGPQPVGARVVGYLDDGTAGQIGDFSGPYWSLEGAGGIAMTANGLEAWARELAAGSIVSADSLDLLFGLETDAAEPFVSLGGGGAVGHNVALVISSAGDVLVIASNTAEVTAEELLRIVEPALRAGATITPPTQAGPVDVAAVEQAVGEYQLDDGSVLAVAVSGTGLAITATGGTALRSLYPAPADFPVETDDHEALVAQFYQGLTAQGREELAILREDAGLAADAEIPFEIVGSAFVAPEIRTYVAVTAGTLMFQCWVALDHLGSVAGIDCAGGPRARQMVSIGASGFVPADSPSGRADVTISFSGDVAIIETPPHTLTAQRQPG